MPPPSKADQAVIVKSLAKALWGTPFECTNMTQLGGGSVNFIFRGLLKKPLSRACNGEEIVVEHVIIKHATGWLSCNKNFVLEASRWDHEVYMLQALEKFYPAATSGRIVVKTPVSYLADEETKVHAMEDICDGVDLRSKLTSQIPSIFQAPYISSLGFAVGDWLWKFHDWAAEPDQAHLREQIRENRAMRELKGRVTYGVLISALEAFPEILSPYRVVLEYAVQDAARDFQRPQHTERGLGVIHGDLWAGNVLFSARNGLRSSLSPSLYVIDWEYVQYGHRAYDLGQMIGDLLEARYFKNSTCATWAMEGFVRGYGPIDDDLAFRTAIHTGAHLIAWGSRRGADGGFLMPVEKVSAVMQMAVDFIVKARRREKRWFMQSPIACLFSTP